MSTLNFSVRARIPEVRQAEVAECGLACIAMIVAFHDMETSLAELRRRFPPSARGMTLADISWVADRIGFVHRALRLEYEDLPKLALPAVLHWGFNHFVVLEHVAHGRLTIVDPARGRTDILEKEARKLFTGVALELKPGDEVKASTKPSERTGPFRLSSVVGSLKSYRSALVQVFVISLGLHLFVLVSPWLMQLVIDKALPAQDAELILVLAVGFGMIAIFRGLLSGARTWAINFITAHLSADILRRLFDHLIRLPLQYFMRRHVADVLSRFQSADVIHRTLTSGAISGIVDGILAVTLLVAMFFYSGLLTAIVLAFSLAYVLLRVGFFPALRSVSLRQIESQAKRDSEFLESIRGIATLRGMNHESARTRRFHERHIAYLNDRTRVARLEAVFESANALLFGLEQVAVVALGAVAVIEQSLSLGMLVAFISYKTTFTERIATLTELIIEFRMLGLHSERVGDIVQSEPEITTTAAPFLSTTGRMEVNDLGFRYAEHEPWLFRNLSFVIEPGEFVAITGPSGCGKSTLLRLICGQLYPVEGQVLVDGKPLTAELARAWRSQLGIVMQDDRLFAGSIADNISGFSEFPNQQQIESAAEQAAIHQDIAAWPMGYETPVGDMGDSLSGGQRQRLFLARGLYRQPKVLLLDEATSHLDSETEREVHEVLEELSITRVCVAHRAETIRRATRRIRMG